MERTEEYQGYRNYPTWSIRQWIMNDQAPYDAWIGATRQALDEAQPDGSLTAKDKATLALSDVLSEEFGAQMPEIEDGLFNDLLEFAFGKIDFYEVAESLIQTALDQIEYEKSQP